MKRVVALLLLLTLVLPVSQVFAASQLKDNYSDAELIGILIADGYSAIEKLKDGVIKVKVDGSTYLLLNDEDGDLQAYFAISDAVISYRDINEWNKSKRFSRAYLDDDDDPVLEADLLADGGLSEKHVTEFFGIFLQSVRAFVDFLVENNQS